MEYFIYVCKKYPHLCMGMDHRKRPTRQDILFEVNLTIGNRKGDHIVELRKPRRRNPKPDYGKKLNIFW